MDDRHHDFRTGCGIAGDMARKGPNIRNALRHALLSCCAADTFAKGNANAGRLALKRTKHQFIAHQPIEARPVEIGQKLPDQGGRSEEHTSELQSLMRISYAVFCLQKTKPKTQKTTNKRP